MRDFIRYYWNVLKEKIYIRRHWDDILEETTYHYFLKNGTFYVKLSRACVEEEWFECAGRERDIYYSRKRTDNSI